MTQNQAKLQNPKNSSKQEIQQAPLYPIYYLSQQNREQSQPWIDPNIELPQGQRNQEQKPYIAIDPNQLNQNLVTAEGQSTPTLIKCQICQQFGVTIVQNKIGKGTLCASILIFIFFFPLFWLPCCLEQCQDKIHLCQSCKNTVGLKKFELF